MFYLDGSEISWLVYADWLEDQGRNGSFVRQMCVDLPGGDHYFEIYDPEWHRVGTPFQNDNKPGRYCLDIWEVGGGDWVIGEDYAGPRYVYQSEYPGTVQFPLGYSTLNDIYCSVADQIVPFDIPYLDPPDFDVSLFNVPS